MAANEIDAASSVRNVLKVLTRTSREDAEVVYQGKVAGVQKNGVNPTSAMTPQISATVHRSTEFAYPRLACFRRGTTCRLEGFSVSVSRTGERPVCPRFSKTARIMRRSVRSSPILHSQTRRTLQPSFRSFPL